MIIEFIAFIFRITQNIFEFLGITPLILFLVKKSLCYGFFSIVAFTLILIPYFSYIPQMNQKVQIQYHLINGKYYGFVFDNSFKNICQITNSDIILEFQSSTLKFQKNFICESIVFEGNNEIQFQDEYYEIQFNIDANYLMPNQKTIVELTSYLITDDNNKNFKQQNLIKLGEQYHLSIFKFLPFRIVIKVLKKLSEILDLHDSYSKTGEIKLFTHIPNQNIKIKAIILEMIAYEAAQFSSEISFVPYLSGIRYYSYYYFFSTLALGTFLLTFLFIIFWEVYQNPSMFLTENELFVVYIIFKQFLQKKVNQRFTKPFLFDVLTQLFIFYYLFHQQTKMECCYILCPSCQVSVGFLNCCTCHKYFVLSQCNGLPVTCPICVNIRLDTYYQSDEDVELHSQCYRNSKRMFYHCQCCNGYFCKCVEKQLKKQIALTPCPLPKRKAQKV
ncbi:unnamed protein product [Paramecium sonneborni]|uniref:Transmembrane protein n=1 Tax=Paramecium sonneborni TaxID=65129 RepID=A0A8S1R2V3_9CILI|nr:unnamed protein product [Paramecium sonneborni]